MPDLGVEGVVASAPAIVGEDLGKVIAKVQHVSIARGIVSGRMAEPHD